MWFAYIPTDCPTAEKRGYLGDAQFSTPGTLWNFKFEPILRSFLTVIADSQNEAGDVPTSVPCPHPGTSHGTCGGGDNWTHPAKWGPAFCNDIAWTVGFPLIMAASYQFSADTRTVSRHYTALTRYIENLIANEAAFPGRVTCDPGDSYWHGQNLARIWHWETGWRHPTAQESLLGHAVRSAQRRLARATFRPCGRWLHSRQPSAARMTLGGILSSLRLPRPGSTTCTGTLALRATAGMPASCKRSTSLPSQ